MVTREEVPVVFLRNMAYTLRCEAIDMIYHGGSGHPGGSLSVAEIVAVLYWSVLNIDPARPDWEGRDRFVLSKGHACPIVYAALAHRGFFDRGLLRTLRHLNSALQGMPDRRKTPGIEMSSGSLGQGLSVGLGMALGARQTGQRYHVYVLLGDGELQEGMVWEAAMAASHWRVQNLTAIVDCNSLQVDGLVDQVMAVEPLADKWRAFGWRADTVEDGHEIDSLLAAFSARRRHDGPAVIICRTVKGKGVSFMEHVMEWHASSVNKEQRDQAIQELARLTGGAWPLPRKEVL